MTTSASAPYQEAQAAKAVAALKAHLATKKTSAPKAALFDDADESDLEDGTVGVADPDLAIWLVVTGKKFFTQDKKPKQERVVLPNPYLTSPSPTFTICLITKDPSAYYRSLISHLPYHPSSITVIAPSKLKTNYKTFEARRQLERSHDIFLADDRIIPLLPSLLGSSIYRRSAKVPIPIKISKIEPPAKDAEAPKSKQQADAGKLQKEIERAITATYFVLAASASQSVKVGIRAQSPEEVAQNVTAVMEHLTSKVVKAGWSGVRAVHLKAAETVALPVYLAERIYDDEDVLTEEEMKRIEHLKTKEGREEREKELKEKKAEKKKGRDERTKAKRNWDSDAEDGEDQYFVRKIKPADDGKNKKRKVDGEQEAPGSAKKVKVDKKAAEAEKDNSEDEEEGGVKLPQAVDLSEQAKKLKIGDKRIAPPAPALKEKKGKKEAKPKSDTGKVGIREKLKRKAKTDAAAAAATKGKKGKAYQ
ncbi:hypothetical protein TWF730_011045 [Orbilia blumenaviensis]|uniref:Ribosomal protein L1 n=1 Tax=Orbilia blumenaviensis TaxID=1796055 RepID=A0AAV9UJJ7_9PEZI